MGYEIKMFIVEPPASPMASEFVEDNGNWFQYSRDSRTKTNVGFSNDKITLNYCWVIAMVELSKVGVTPFPKKNTEYYFYDYDGNTPVVKDAYHDFLQEASLESVIGWLELQIASGLEYRKYKTALALAKSCVGLYDNPTVLLFGH